MHTVRLPALMPLLVCVLAACDQSSPKQAPAADPWAGSATPSKPAAAADPWSAPASPSAPATPASASAPTTPSAPSAAAGDTPAELDGHWACQTPTTRWNVMTKFTEVVYVPSPLPHFWIASGRYETKNSSASTGTVAFANNALTFHGGAYDSARAAVNHHDDGRPYIVFRKTLTADPEPGVSTRFGETYCAKQTD